MGQGLRSGATLCVAPTEVVEGFLESHPDFRSEGIEEILPKRCHSLIENGYFKTFPPKGGMDGFFAARLVKKR